jgi:hypothetical protein
MTKMMAVKLFYILKKEISKLTDHAIAQAVSRRLRMAWFEPRSGHVGFVVGKVALGQVFSEYFGFPCQFSFHQVFHTYHHPNSSGVGTIGQ